MRGGLLRGAVMTFAGTLAGSFAATFAAFLLALFSVWVLYALLGELEPLFDALAFARLLVTSPLPTQFAGWQIVFAELAKLILLAGPFMFMRHRARYMAAAVFFVFLLASHTMVYPPAVLSNWDQLALLRGFPLATVVLWILPFVMLACLGLVAGLGLTPLGHTFDRLVARGVLPRLSLRGASHDTVQGLRIVSTLSATLILFLGWTTGMGPLVAPGRSPDREGATSQTHGTDQLTTSLLSLIIVVPRLDVTAMRKASASFSPRLAQWMAESDDVSGHLPQVPLARPMRYELLRGSPAMESGVLSDFGSLPELTGPDHVEQRPSALGHVRIVAPRPAFQTMALWYGTIPLSGWEAELARVSRQAINPMFARIGWGRDEAAAAVSPTDVSWAFEHLRKKAEQALGDDSESARANVTRAVRLFVELPDFPMDSPSAVQQDYFEHLLSLTEALAQQSRRAVMVTMVGLPAEQYVDLQSFRPQDLTWVVRRSTGVSVSWSVPNNTEGAGIAKAVPRRSFEDRMRDVEEGQGIQSTYCLGKRIAGAADCSRRSLSSLIIAWSGAYSSLLPVSDFRRFLKLTAVFDRPAQERFLPALAARIRDWPQPDPILRPGDVIDQAALGDDVTSSEGSIRLSKLLFEIAEGRHIVLGPGALQ